MKFENEVNYLRDASVAKVVGGGAPLRVGFPCPGGAFVRSGEWLVATRNFRLLGGVGGEGEVKEGQRFRLLRAASPVDLAVWEIA